MGAGLVTDRATETGCSRRAGRNARRVGLTALTVAALAPLFMPGFGTKPVIDLSSINSDGRIRVSPLVSMGAVLSQAQQDGGNVEVFQVQTDHPSYWRMVALDSFDGTTGTWEAVPDDGEIVARRTARCPASAAAGDPSEQTFTISSDLGYAWLAVPPDPLTFQIDHEVTLAPRRRSSAEVDSFPDAGETYSVTSIDAEPDGRASCARSGAAERGRGRPRTARDPVLGRGDGPAVDRGAQTTTTTR